MTRHASFPLALILALASLGATASDDVVDRDKRTGSYVKRAVKCIEQALTPEDRALHARWAFALVSAHPAVQSLTAISPEQRDDLSKKVASMYLRLLTKDCKTQTSETMKHEGLAGARRLYHYLGMFAAQELFKARQVQEALAAKPIGEVFEFVFDKDQSRSQ